MMYREIRDFSERTGKPVIASFGEIAASGGYYIALASDHIIAEQTSLTGSIGVIVPTFNFSQGLARIGIFSRSVTSGDNKDIANPFEPMREEHYALLQGMVDEFHGQFRSIVLARRGPGDLAIIEQNIAALRTEGPQRRGRRFIDPGQLAHITDGRIMTGLQAYHHGLVDQTGGIMDAFETAKVLAGLDRARLVKFYREDADRPRTAYGTSPTPAAARTESMEINLLQIRGPALGLAELEAGLPYYLYIPAGAL
jgi:protease IV